MVRLAWISATTRDIVKKIGKKADISEAALHAQQQFKQEFDDLIDSIQAEDRQTLDIFIKHLVHNFKMFGIPQTLGHFQILINDAITNTKAEFLKPNLRWREKFVMGDLQKIEKKVDELGNDLQALNSEDRAHVHEALKHQKFFRKRILQMVQDQDCWFDLKNMGYCKPLKPDLIPKVA